MVFTDNNALGIVLKQDDDLNFTFTDEMNISEDVNIVITIGDEEYTITIATTDGATEEDSDKMKEYVRTCLFMSDDEFDLFQDHFVSELKQQFGLGITETVLGINEVIMNIREDIKSNQVQEPPHKCESCALVGLAKETISVLLNAGFIKTA